MTCTFILIHINMLIYQTMPPHTHTEGGDVTGRAKETERETESEIDSLKKYQNAQPLQGNSNSTVHSLIGRWIDDIYR